MTDNNVVAANEGSLTAYQSFDIIMRRMRENCEALRTLIAGSNIQTQVQTYGNLAADLLSERSNRRDVLDASMLGDPVWDMLLDLIVAEEQTKDISVTSLCQASDVPQSTALRWITVMVDCGMVTRREDNLDKRRTFVELTSATRAKLVAYLNKTASSRGITIVDPLKISCF
jgi:DNA-binding MarR family transcriptional regulator